MVQRCLAIFGALALAVFSTRSVTAGGVTIITHGFNSNVTDWIIPMAGRMGQYPGFPGTTYSCYEISITRNGFGQYVAAASLIGGTAPLLTDSGEIAVKLDWSTLSGFGGRIHGLNASSGLPPQKAYDWNGSFVPKIGRSLSGRS